jgi:hypothetical protein
LCTNPNDLKRLFFLLTVVFGLQTGYAQINVRDSLVNGWLIMAQIGGYVPGGDIATRFGNSMLVGAGVHYKFQSQWTFGFDGGYRFGNSVKNRDQIFADILTSRGEIIAANGDVAIVNLFQRGWQAHAHVSKIFTRFGHNANSGPTFAFGGGYHENKIHIDNPGNDAIQIIGEYSKGYDQLHGGVSLYQMLGYTYFGDLQTVNFFIGLEFAQGYTVNMRGFNYQTRLPERGNKRDFYYGIRLQWFIPIWDKNAQTFFYY